MAQRKELEIEITPSGEVKVLVKCVPGQACIEETKFLEEALGNEIKDREDFRPVAPVVLEEEAGDWFVGCSRSPFMLFVYQVAPDKAGRIPAVTHVDGTARVQTINRAQHPLYYDLLKAFQARTGSRSKLA